ncbi:MAG TPA: methyltransferase domain-containing protein [Gaiellaceae bacterium]|nr:methyltransferase domain-containing protein [Gaiellaceae bacterium]
MRTLDDERRTAAEMSGGHSSEAIYRIVIASARNAGNKKSLLDVGAGDGSLTRELIPFFDRVVALDLVDHEGRNAAPAAQWITADLNAALPLADGEFDVVVAAEVIEHLENPRFAVREWFRVLSAGGRLVITTPNNESWRSLLSLAVRGHFAAFTGASYPAHVTALTRLDLERILGEAGFERTELSFTDHGAVPRLTRLTWQQLSRGRLRGLRFSDNLCCSAIKPR